MHGLILVQFQKFIHRVGGPFAWQLVCRECGLPPKTYLPNQAYSDGETMALVMAASRVFMQAPGDFLEEFGKFLAPELLSFYSDLLDPQWTMFELLERVHQIFHSRVRQEVPGVLPPKLVLKRLGQHRALLTYSSPRNLCRLARGIVVGVGNLHQEYVALRETECTLRGDAQCVFDITLLTDRKKQQVSFARTDMFQIIEATPTDLSLLMLWLSGEGINPRIVYVNILQKMASTDGVVAKLHDQTVGVVWTCRVNPSFGLILAVVVDPEYRFSGIGKSLLEAGLAGLSSQLTGDATIGMDVPASFVPTALKYSFAPSQRIRHMKAFGVPRVLIPDTNVVSATSVPVESIADYDAQCFRMRRDHLIASVLEEVGRLSWVYVDGTAIRGVCVSGHSRNGIRILLLVADTDDIASAPLNRCLANFPSEAVFLDVPVHNSSAVTLAKEFGMVEVYQFNRLYKGVDPRFDYSRIYCVSLNGIL
ncbi:MAG: hypothetical protein DWH81_07145 [Planctomycetota bacterium]|nr:MAG: hypothetical protein DWH81_07145 [Planctomycetota bacterium]